MWCLGGWGGGRLQKECQIEHFKYKFGCVEDVYSGLKCKHVRIQSYFNTPGVYLGEAEDLCPKNIRTPWFHLGFLLCYF